jgi:predicted GNAT superfamily acetyltransferase
MRIRPLTTIEECRKVVDLEKAVWEYTDAEDVVPVPILIVSIKRGGILLGAFDEAGEMKGFVYSLASIKNGQPAQWSHMLGVTRDARSSGLGAALKVAQREQALRMGVELIEWTFDPLQAPNAHLNFAKLGVVAEEYEENIYGDSSSPLHRGTPTDRFIAEWHLTRPHVERRLAGGGPAIRDASLVSAPLVNPVGISTSSRLAWRSSTGTPVLDLQARRLLVEIPTGFSEMQAQNPDLALQWRHETRRIFTTYFAAGYRAVDFFLSREAARGHYVLARKEEGA